MAQACDVAIIGAGPHGLSIAAHLAARGIDYRIFGRPMTTWSEHMPKNMIAEVRTASPPTSRRHLNSRNPHPQIWWPRRQRVGHADQGLPIPIDTFLSYAHWFQKRYVPDVEPTNVVALDEQNGGFMLQLETGETVMAKHGRGRWHHLVRASAAGSGKTFRRRRQPQRGLSDPSKLPASRAAKLPWSAPVRPRSVSAHRASGRRVVAADRRARRRSTCNKVPDAADETLIGTAPCARRQGIGMKRRK